MTVTSVFLLQRLRKRVDSQTLEIIRIQEQVKQLPNQTKNQLQETVDEVKGRLKLIWHIFMWIRRYRKKKKLKKRMMKG